MKKRFIAVFAVVVIALLAGSVYAAQELRDPVAVQNIGYFAYEQGRFGLAESLFRKAISLDPSYEHARMDLAVLLHEQGRYAEASEQLRALTRLDEESAQYWYDLGVNLIAEFRHGSHAVADFEDGIGAYERAAAIDDGYARVQSNLAALYEVREELYALRSGA